MSHPIASHSNDGEFVDLEATSQHSISLDEPEEAHTFSFIPLDGIRDSLSSVSSPRYTLNSSGTDDQSIYSNENGVRESANTFLIGDWDDDRASSFDGSDSKTPYSPLFTTSPSLDTQPNPPRIGRMPEAILTPLIVGKSHQSADTTPVLSNPRGFASTVPKNASTYPPTPYPPVMPSPPRSKRDSLRSFASSSSTSRKIRPESLLLRPPDGPIVLGIALVDFNHLEGPNVEFSRGAICEDQEIAKILPFLALPDGAHLSSEDYSYFHLVPSGPTSTTVFGISCNRQIASSDLLVKGHDVTRSTVQKALVVLASRPVFGPIRDKLGVVTRALFEQRDFTEKKILEDFDASLEPSLRSQMTESGLYIGTSLRRLVHTFRQRTLILVKALMLQKRIMFSGHPVERLCTYQYSLVSLLPGLLQTLEDCGSPVLATRAPTLTRPNSLRTSDRKSMLAYLGLPLDTFGKDAFFQPYLPLQQLDVLRETKSWLAGSTNSIVTQQREIDLLVDTENGTIEFRDPTLERSAGLTAADRKWMDEIVRDVNESWNEGDAHSTPILQFKGSDDYLRAKFEEYVSAALVSVKYQDFLAKGDAGSGVIAGTGGDAQSTEDFNPQWIREFKKTNAYEVWDRTTDPVLFDIVEPRHPCNEKPSVVADLGLRIQEGLQDLKLEQQLAPTREVITRSFNVGSANLMKAMEGVSRWTRNAAANSASLNELMGTKPNPSTPITPPRDVTGTAAERSQPPDVPFRPLSSGIRSFSLQPISSRLRSNIMNNLPPSIVNGKAAEPPSGPPPSASSGWGGFGALWSTPSKVTLPKISPAQTHPDPKLDVPTS